MTGPRQRRDDDEGRRRNQVVEDDEPNSTVAIEQGAGDRADDRPGKMLAKATSPASDGSL